VLSKICLSFITWSSFMHAISVANSLLFWHIGFSVFVTMLLTFILPVSFMIRQTDCFNSSASVPLNCRSFLLFRQEILLVPVVNTFLSPPGWLYWPWSFKFSFTNSFKDKISPVQAICRWSDSWEDGWEGFEQALELIQGSLEASLVWTSAIFVNWNHSQSEYFQTIW
jgi:hypothetical protein